MDMAGKGLKEAKGDSKVSGLSNRRTSSRLGEEANEFNVGCRA